MNKQDSKKYFKGHPGTNEFFVTTEGSHFFLEQMATNHSNSLPKDAQGVTTVTREEACGDEDAAEEVVVAEVATAEVVAEEVVAPKVAAEEVAPKEVAAPKVAAPKKEETKK